MSRRENAAFRCERCRMHRPLCVCSLVPRVETRTRLVLIIHQREEKKTTNTGRLAAACLPHSITLVRGRKDEPEAPWQPHPGRQGVILFPDEEAVPLASYARSDLPVDLIVPDGTWRQAAKVKNRVEGLQGLPCVSLPDGPMTSYRLRAEHREGGLATFEAIMRALVILEGPHVERAMEPVFRAMVERTLWSRGRLSAGQVAAGVGRQTRKRRGPEGDTFQGRVRVRWEKKGE